MVKHQQNMIIIFVIFTIISVVMSITPNSSKAEVIDPEKYIHTNGYHSKKLGDDGKTTIYTYTDRTVSNKIIKLENDIAKLPKQYQILSFCDQLRGGVKALLIESTGKSIDVAVINYGYFDSTVACTLKFMLENKVGTQLMYLKNSGSSIYIVYVTD